MRNNRRLTGLVVFLIGVCLTVGICQGRKPKVLIIGDSISIGYTNMVAERLVDKADVVRIKGDEVTYNAIAAKVMAENGIVINDLYGHMLPKSMQYYRKPADVHYTSAGSSYLADKVASSILTVLKPKSAPAQIGMAEQLPAESRTSFEDDQTRAHVFVDADWFNWGASVIQGEDEKYHMFYARWPRRLKFTAWLTHSEIAHAVSDRPEGPYRYIETVIKARGTKYWDQVTAHNPKIKYFEGKYYLYYISAKGDYSQDVLVEIAATGYSHQYWMTLRNSQRTGVALADTLDGPWKRLDKPVVEPAGPITKLTVNPAVTRGPDGTYFMIVKGDKPGSRQRNQALATAKNPVGPFEIYPEPVIDTFDTEDASMWYDKQRQQFYAVFHAHTHIGIVTSKDGYHWAKADPYTMSLKQVQFDDGEILKLHRMERPFVLLDDEGAPSMLFVSARLGNDSMNIHLPIEWPAD